MTSSNKEKKKTKHFVQLYDNIIDELLEATQDPLCLVVFYALVRHRNYYTGECFPSIATLSKQLHMSESTIKRKIKMLKDFDFIYVNSGGKGTSNHYFFCDEEYKGRTQRTVEAKDEEDFKKGKGIYQNYYEAPPTSYIDDSDDIF